MAWLPWSSDAFETARSLGKPVLLLLPQGGPQPASEWERLCAAKAVAAAAESFILVRVLAHERPDVQARYRSGGDGLLILDCDGEVLQAFGYQMPEPLSKALTARSGAYQPPAAPGDASAAAWTGAVGDSQTSGVRQDLPAASLEALLAERSGLHGVPGALDLLLYAGREWGHAEAKARLLLELVELSGLQDKKTGAFSGPEGPELTANAELCRLFWDAFAFAGLPALRETAGKLTDFLLRGLFDPSVGAFKHSAAAATSFHPEGNAKAAYALLRSAAFPGDGRRLQAATQALVFLQTEVYDPADGLRRERSGGRGLLADHAWTALAFSESFLMTGQRQQREFADSLMRALFQEFWDRGLGGFLDRAPEPSAVGRLRVPLRPLEDNAAAFEALWRLHHLKGNANYRKWLDWGLSSLTQGGALAAMAPLARVQDMMARGRMELELVGRPGEVKTDALLAALHRNYLPRKIVSFVDPDDQDYILAHKLQADSYPRLFGCLDFKAKANASEPDQVPAVLEALSK